MKFKYLLCLGWVVFGGVSACQTVESGDVATATKGQSEAAKSVQNNTPSRDVPVGDRTGSVSPDPQPVDPRVRRDAPATTSGSTPPPPRPADPRLRRNAPDALPPRPPTQSEPSGPAPVAMKHYDYEVALTGKASSQDRLPLIVALHHMGGDAKSSMEDYAQLKTKARVVSLEGSHGIDGGYSWFPEGYYNWPAARQAALTVEIADKVGQTVQHLAQTYPTDDKPVIVGYSQGGDIAHLLAMRHGADLKLVIPMGARNPEKWMVADELNLGEVNVVIFHGMDDEAVDISEARAASDFYQRNLVVSYFNRYPGYGHEYADVMQEDYERLIADSFLK